jgi:hypothetical protein
MGKVTSSGQNNITSPNGNSLAVFVDGVTEVIKLKDVMGNIQPLSDFTGCKSPFKYNVNGTGIEPILGTNDASGCYATIGGGRYNIASNDDTTVGGGSCNIVSGNDSFIGGGRCNLVDGVWSIIGGGFINVNSGCVATIGGGWGNQASGFASTVGGGFCNRITSLQTSTIAGGRCNIISDSFSAVGGGFCNINSGYLSVIAGGDRNINSGGRSAILGGDNGVVNSNYSAILGGSANKTCGFEKVMIVGSNICATQSCTTFANCLSAQNLTAGCLVSVGANKVLQNSSLSVSTINFGLFAQTADSTPITATTVESSLIGAGVGTLSVPANGFTIGNSFVARLDGIISAVGTATLHIRIKTVGGVVLADTGVIAMDASTVKAWTLDLEFTVRTLGGVGVASISSGGLFSYIKNSGLNFEGYVLSTVNSTTFDTTINNTLVITAQWNTNNAGNSIFSRNFVLNKVF